MYRIAIIPARKNSKGVAGKNMAQVGGMTLVARAVRCALDSECFDDVVISTDGEEIAREAELMGAHVPGLRPDELAEDTTNVLDVIRYTITTLENQGASNIQTVALLEPTSPLRTPEIVCETVQAAELKGFDAALTVTSVPLHYHPFKQFRLHDSGAVSHFTDQGEKIVRRQELATTYIRNGMCYVTRRIALDAGHGVLGTNPKAVVIKHVPLINIDTKEDLQAARSFFDNSVLHKK